MTKNHYGDELNFHLALLHPVQFAIIPLNIKFLLDNNFTVWHVISFFRAKGVRSHPESDLILFNYPF